jgi:Fe2+ or Zn2+ uptake regulation protein
LQHKIASKLGYKLVGHRMELYGASTKYNSDD